MEILAILFLVFLLIGGLKLLAFTIKVSMFLLVLPLMLILGLSLLLTYSILGVALLPLLGGLLVPLIPVVLVIWGIILIIKSFA